MSRRSTHTTLGIPAGSALAAYRARHQDFLHALLEAAGGGLGGWLGALLPDWLEPAVHSFHRNIAHSVAAGVAVAEGARRGLRSWESYWRNRADEFANKRRQADGDIVSILLNLMAEGACRILAGIAAGIVGGFASHLVLDAGTPRSIPLISRHII